MAILSTVAAPTDSSAVAAPPAGAPIRRSRQDGEGGDPGLFKGIFFRYLDQFLQVRPVPELLKFVRSATDALWANQVVETSTGTVLRAGDDWNLPAPDRVTYSSQLSAVMALEVRARHD